MGLRILQISDIHLFADPGKELLGVKTQESFQAVLNLIKLNEPDVKLIILSGDLSQDNSLASYTQLTNMLQPFQVPVYYIPGNHDDPKLMATIFPRENIRNDKHIIIGNWQIILLNSQKPGAVEGLLDQSQLTYLQECLQAYPAHQAIVVFHHHPFYIGCQWLDNLWLTNADEFWHVIANYQNVNTVLFGHVHQEHAKQVNNINCYSAPSTCFQFMRHQNHFGLEHLSQGYRWLELQEDGRLETGVERVPTYVGNFDVNAKGYK